MILKFIFDIDRCIMSCEIAFQLMTLHPEERTSIKSNGFALLDNEPLPGPMLPTSMAWQGHNNWIHFCDSNNRKHNHYLRQKSWIWHQYIDFIENKFVIYHIDHNWRCASNISYIWQLMLDYIIPLSTMLKVLLHDLLCISVQFLCCEYKIYITTSYIWEMLPTLCRIMYIHT